MKNLSELSLSLFGFGNQTSQMRLKLQVESHEMGLKVKQQP